MCIRALLFGAAIVGISGAAFGETLYDNTTTDTGKTATLSGDVWADDIHMVGTGGLVDQIMFGFDSNGSTEVTVSIYDNTASDNWYPGQNAGQLWIDTYTIDPNFSGVMTLDINPLYLDPDIWFTVQFDHFEGAMWLYNPPTTGTSDEVLLKGNGSGWTGSAPRAYFEPGMNNFYVKIGGPGVPAPGTLGVLGVCGLFVGRRRRGA